MGTCLHDCLFGFQLRWLRGRPRILSHLRLQYMPIDRRAERRRQGRQYHGTYRDSELTRVTQPPREAGEQSTVTCGYRSPGSDDSSRSPKNASLTALWSTGRLTTEGLPQPPLQVLHHSGVVDREPHCQLSDRDAGRPPFVETHKSHPAAIGAAPERWSWKAVHLTRAPLQLTPGCRHRPVRRVPTKSHQGASHSRISNALLRLPNQICKRCRGVSDLLHEHSPSSR